MAGAAHRPRFLRPPRAPVRGAFRLGSSSWLGMDFDSYGSCCLFEKVIPMSSPQRAIASRSCNALASAISRRHVQILEICATTGLAPAQAHRVAQARHIPRGQLMAATATARTLTDARTSSTIVGAALPSLRSCRRFCQTALLGDAATMALLDESSSNPGRRGPWIGDLAPSYVAVTLQ